MSSESKKINSNSFALERLRVGWLYRQSRVTQLAGLLNAGIYVYFSKDFVSSDRLLAWSAFIIVLYSIRMWSQNFFNTRYASQRRPFNPVFWEAFFAIGTFLAGSAWGVAGSLFLPPGEITYQTFIAFFLAGNTAAAAVAYSPSQKSMLAFLLPSLLPFALRLATAGSAFQYGMSLLVVSYVILFSILMKKMNSFIVESIQLRFDKDHLFNELKEAHAKITYAAKMAALGEMAGGISHEINNPLTVVQGSAQRLMDLVEDEQVNPQKILSLANDIDGMCMRMAKIITGLSAFAREGQEDPYEVVSVKKLVTGTLDFCRSRFHSHGIRLGVSQIPSDLAVECRYVLISQALLNLLNNAFDALAGQLDSWVNIEVEQQSGSIKFSITDSGKGISENIRDKIMQPFFTTKEVGKGTGLGLSITKGIIESHEGIFYLDSTSSHTCFVFTLPRATRLEEKIVA